MSKITCFCCCCTISDNAILIQEEDDAEYEYCEHCGAKKLIDLKKRKFGYSVRFEEVEAETDEYDGYDVDLAIDEFKEKQNFDV